MNRFIPVLAAVLVCLACLPNSAVSQSVIYENITVFAGAEYPMIHTEKEGPVPGPVNDFRVRPHFQISYEFPPVKSVSPVVFAGFNQLGGEEYFTLEFTSPARFREVHRIQTLSLGIKGLVEMNHFKMGPVASGHTVLASEKNLYRRLGDGWYEEQASRYRDNIRRFTLHAGLALQRDLGSRFRILFEGLYGLTDIHKPGELALRGESHNESIDDATRWHPVQLRLSVGYNF